jgi:hypothetical protein
MRIRAIMSSHALNRLSTVTGILFLGPRRLSFMLRQQHGRRRVLRSYGRVPCRPLGAVSGRSHTAAPPGPDKARW